MTEGMLQDLQSVASVDGLIPFSTYMHIALYGANGYYQQHARLGGHGSDFYTAAQFPLFGRCLAKYVFDKWLIDQPQSPVSRKLEIVELGPGQGEIAAAVLDYLGTVVPQDTPIRYTLVERSEHLRKVHARRLAAISPRIEVAFESDMTAVGWRGARVFVLANELLDALPVELVRRRASGWEQAYVEVPRGLTDALQVQWRIADTEVAKRASIYAPVPIGTQAELCLQYNRVFQSCAMLANQVDAVFIDYGIFRDEWAAGIRPSGTVRGFAKHQWVDILQTPGWSDITADVNWDMAVAEARDCGFEVHPIQSQAAFLMAAGIAEIAVADAARKDGVEANTTSRTANLDNKTIQAMKTLILPGGMGERFSVLTCALKRGGEEAGC